MDSKKKKILYQFGLPIILGTILLLGVSYAWFSLTLSGTKTNVLKAGTLSLILDDTMGEGINLEKAVPMLDRDGLSQIPYTFTLTNTGDVKSEYTIYLDDVALEASETKLSDSAIKYNLTRDNVSMVTNLLSEIGSSPNRVLDTGVIAPDESYTFQLRLWIDENASNAEMNKVFKGKLRVVAEQVIEQPPTSESCFITSDMEDGTIQIDQYICGPTVPNENATDKVTNTNSVNNITNVVIPSIIGGKQVTVIGDQSFARTSITSVIIPESVVVIGDFSFGGNELTDIEIPGNVTTIKSTAFSDNQLTSVVIPRSVMTLGELVFSSNQLKQIIIQGKNSSADFTQYGGSMFGPFDNSWASGYSDANIIWQP